MLELIVLGKVPGTEFHITFVQVLIAGLMLLLVSLYSEQRDAATNTTGDISQSATSGSID